MRRSVQQSDWFASADRADSENPLQHSVKLNKVGLLGLGSITVLPGKMTIASYIIPPREVTSHGLTELTSLILNTNVYDDAGKLQFMTLYGGFEEK